MCIYIYIYIYTHIRVYTYIYIYIYTHVFDTRASHLIALALQLITGVRASLAPVSVISAMTPVLMLSSYGKSPLWYLLQALVADYKSLVTACFFVLWLPNGRMHPLQFQLF